MTTSSLSRIATLNPTASRRRTGSSRRVVVVAVTTAVMIVIALFWVSPLIILLMTGFRSSTDFLQHGPLSIPSTLTFENFSKAWITGNFGQTYLNSFIVGIIKVPLGVFISAMLAFALAKLRLPGRPVVLFAVFLGLTVPIYIALVPLFNIVKTMGLIDNVFGLIGPYLAFGIPFEVLVLHAFFRAVPDEIIEAAKVDGANSWRVFIRIVLPLSLPALVTVAILDAVATWNELLMALVIINSDQNKTLPLGLLNFTGQFGTDFTGLAAGIMIAVVPMLVAYAMLQRYIVSGLTSGAVKG